MSSLRRNLTVTGAVLAALVLVAVVVGTLAFLALLDVRTDVIDEVDPAMVQVERLVGAMVDQEAAVRGYALSGDEQFLSSLRAAEFRASVARDEIGRLVGHRDSLRAPLERVDETIDAWIAESAEPIIDTVDGGDEPDLEVVEASRERLGEVRTAVAVAQDRLDELHAEGRADLDRQTTLLVGVLLATLAGIVAYAVGVSVVARRQVLGPIDRLRADAVAVAWGDLQHEVVPSGPSELTEVGASVEAMRQRMVADLELVEQAFAELEQRAEELSRSNRDLEQFAYVASHDLQEPLRKVASFCQLLQQRYAGQLDERADQYIEFAVDGAKRMQGLINDLLAFSRVGRTTERFEPVDLDVLFDGVLADLGSRIEETGATVERLSPLPTVAGDRSLLGTLLLNLVANSIKFRGDDPPVVRVSVERHDDGWCFTVSDNGIGIDEQYADRVFVIFQRLHGRDQYEGTGIGLALCKKIVEFHGGTIWIAGAGSGDTGDTGAGAGGTTIHWTLPAAAGERSAE